MNTKRNFYDYGAVLMEILGCILTFPFVFTGTFLLFIGTMIAEVFSIREKINKIWKVL